MLIAQFDELKVATDVYTYVSVRTMRDKAIIIIFLGMTIRYWMYFEAMRAWTEVRTVRIRTCVISRVCHRIGSS